MKNKKIIFCIFLLILCLSLSGCSSIFLREDALVTDKNELPATAAVQDLTTLGPGNLQDVSTDGSQLLVFSTSKAPPVSYNIELYQHQKNGWSVINFVSSDKPNVSGIFSSDGLGIFYTKSDDTDDYQNKQQLMWTSLDKTKTLTLSDEDESIVTALCRMPDGKVLYANDHHQICVVNASGWRKNYAIDPDYSIDTLGYDSANEQIVFSGTNKENSTLNLYLTDVTKGEIEPKLLDTDILSYDLNPDTGSIAYIKQSAEDQQLILYNSSNGQTKKIGNFSLTSAILNADDSAILYTVPLSSSDTQHKIIKMMSVDGKNISQITSPRIIVSKLFFAEKKIYFSVMDEEADSDSDTYDSTIYALTLEFTP